jgi:predicted anti-sigma-YlaC factor YlaD
MQVSLDLDDALSQLEKSFVSAHLARCSACRAYADEAARLTHALRSAPLETLDTPVVVRRRRRIAFVQAQSAVAAIVALAMVGLVSQLASSHSDRSGTLSARITKYQSKQDLEYELRLMSKARAVAQVHPQGGGSASSSALA